tara:strand:- start:2533 stop:3090 length:558 start_codon:yes stop_codon:yes gene_type:complete
MQVHEDIILPRRDDEAPAQPLRLLAACVATQVCILWILGPIATSLLEVQLCFDPDRFSTIVRGWSTSGELWRFKAHFALDLVLYPVLYGLLLRRRSAALGMPRWVARLATAGAALDVAENALHLGAMLAGELHDAPDWLVLAAASAASVKWCVLLPVVVALMPRGDGMDWSTFATGDGGGSLKEE